MSRRFVSTVLFAAALSGCGGVFESELPASQAYVLRLPEHAATTTATPLYGSVLLQRPEAAPGLDSDRIALLRAEQRFDYYAASRWAGPVPDMLESVIVDALRANGSFAAVFEDTAPFAPRYDLRVTLRRFESDYTAGGRAPTVHVVLNCTLGRHRDRVLLGSFTARGSAVAVEDRLSAVVAAYQSATSAAVAELERAMLATLAAETPAADSPSESR